MALRKPVKGPKGQRPIVIIESPYAGNVDLNVRYARACVRDSILRGEAPYASHLLYTQPGILNDDDPAERKLGIETGFVFRRAAQVIAFYIDLGLSGGMRQALERCAAEKVPYVQRKLPRDVLNAVQTLDFDLLSRSRASGGIKL